jgi:hypothetical protein
MSYRDPTTEELKSPLFNAIWNEIKSWDIRVPEEYGGYMGATGNHVCAILDAIVPPAAAKECIGYPVLLKWWMDAEGIGNRPRNQIQYCDGDRHSVHCDLYNALGKPAAAEADPTCIRCWRHRSEHATLANGIFCPSVAGRQMANCTFIGPPAAAEEEGSNEPTNL